MKQEEEVEDDVRRPSEDPRKKLSVTADQRLRLSRFGCYGEAHRRAKERYKEKSHRCSRSMQWVWWECTCIRFRHNNNSQQLRLTAKTWKSSIWFFVCLADDEQNKYELKGASWPRHGRTHLYATYSSMEGSKNLVFVPFFAGSLAC